MTHIHLVKMFI